MDAHLPIAVGELADGECVVKVLGVTRIDGEGGYAAEVLAARHLLRSDPFADSVGGFLHILRIPVGEAELGKDGMHLRIVFPFRSEDIYYLAARIHLVIAPVGDARHGLVAALASAKPALVEDDVGGEKLGVGDERGIILLYPESADKLLVLRLQNLDHAGFRVLTPPGGGNHHPDFVAVESMHRIALRHHDILVVDHNGILAVAAAHEISDILRTPVGFRLVLAEVHLQNVAGSHKIVKHVDNVQAVRLSVGPDSERYLLIVETLLVLHLQKLQYTGCEVLLPHPAAPFVYGFAHGSIIICNFHHPSSRGSRVGQRLILAAIAAGTASLCMPTPRVFSRKKGTDT